MTEIDDVYQEEVETLEQEFFEKIKTTKDRKALLEQYRKDLASARKTFERDYEEYLNKEMKRVQHPVKKKGEKETFKHLEPRRVELSMNAWQKFKVHWSLFWFGVSRTYHKFIAYAVPNFVLYLYYKIKVTLKAVWRETKRWTDSLWQQVKTWTINISVRFWKGLMKFIGLSASLLKKVLLKMMFWRREKKGKEGEGTKDGEAKSTEGESKDESSTKEDEGKDESPKS